MQGIGFDQYLTNGLYHAFWESRQEHPSESFYRELRCLYGYGAAGAKQIFSLAFGISLETFFLLFFWMWIDEIENQCSWFGDIHRWSFGDRMGMRPKAADAWLYSGSSYFVRGNKESGRDKGRKATIWTFGCIVWRGSLFRIAVWPILYVVW